MNIFKLTQQHLQLMNELQENGGEITPIIEQSLAVNEQNFIEKVNGYVAIIKQLDGDVTAIDEEIKRLQHLKKVKSNNMEWLKGTLANAVDVVHGGSYDGGTFKLSVRRSKSVSIDQESQIPDTYKTEKITVSVSKSAVKVAIEEGKQVPGASIVESINLQIR